jgi:hypothetical protein
VEPDVPVLRVLQDEEDEHGGDGDARVECRGEDVCASGALACIHIQVGKGTSGSKMRKEGKTHNCTLSTTRNDGGG